MSNTFFITSISVDGMLNIPLSMKGVTAGILFELPGTKEELIIAIGTETQFNAKFSYRDIKGRCINSNIYAIKLELFSNDFNNLSLRSEKVCYHTEISIDDFCKK